MVISKLLVGLTATWLAVAAASVMGAPPAASSTRSAATPKGSPSIQAIVQHTQATVQRQDGSSQGQLITRYCVTCHNSRLKTAGLALDVQGGVDVGEAPAIWEKV